ncbi:MAG: hypothetical protein OZ948_04335 [Deltaproteobacteria bacterium]|nr:hypothetical protein [Deltaproteobacteria bacterium]
MERRPRILASFVRSVLDGVDRSDLCLGERVRARIGEATRDALAAAGPISFVPVELDVEVTEALFAEAGEARGREIERENLLLTFDAPILSSFMNGALRLLGRDPARLFGWSAKVWGQLYRDCGTIRFVPEGESRGRLELDGLPACIAASRPYLAGMEAAFDAAFTLLDVEGSVRLESADSRGRASYEVAWK